MSNELAAVVLRETGIDSARIEEALQRQVLEGGGLDTVLQEMGLIDEDLLLPLLAKVYGLSPVGRDDVRAIDPGALAVFPQRLAEKHGILPLELSGRRLSVAVAKKPDITLLDEIGFMLSVYVRPFVTTEARLAYGLYRLYRLPLPPRIESLLAMLGEDPAAELEDDIEAGASESKADSTDAVAASAAKEAAGVKPANWEVAGTANAELQPKGGAPEYALSPATSASALLGSRPKEQGKVGQPSLETENHGGPGHERGGGQQDASGRLSAIETSAPEKPGVTDAAGDDVEKKASEAAAATDEARSQAPDSDQPSSDAEREQVRLRLLAAVERDDAEEQERAKARHAERVRWTVDDAIAELAMAGNRDEMVDVVLRFAHRRLTTAAMFVVNKNHFSGWDIIDEVIDRSAVSKIVISAQGHHALGTLFEMRSPFLGPLAEDDPLALALDRQPRAALLVPVMVEDKLAAVLYGDCGAGTIPPSSLAELHMVAPRFGKALRNLILRQRSQIDDDGQPLAPEIEPAAKVEQELPVIELELDDFDEVLERSAPGRPAPPPGEEDTALGEDVDLSLDDGADAESGLSSIDDEQGLENVLGQMAVASEGSFGAADPEADGASAVAAVVGVNVDLDDDDEDESESEAGASSADDEAARGDIGEDAPGAETDTHGKDSQAAATVDTATGRVADELLGDGDVRLDFKSAYAERDPATPPPIPRLKRKAKNRGAPPEAEPKEVEPKEVEPKEVEPKEGEPSASSDESAHARPSQDTEDAGAPDKPIEEGERAEVEPPAVDDELPKDTVSSGELDVTGDAAEVDDAKTDDAEVDDVETDDVKVDDVEVDDVEVDDAEIDDVEVDDVEVDDVDDVEIDEVAGEPAEGSRAPENPRESSEQALEQVRVAKSPGADARDSLLLATWKDWMAHEDPSMDARLIDLQKPGEPGRAAVGRVVSYGDRAMPSLARYFPGVLALHPFGHMDSRPDVRDFSDALACMVRLGADCCAPVLLAEADHEDRLHRYAAIWGLSVLRVPVALKVLTQRVFDPEYRIALLVLEVLEAYRDQPSFPVILEQLRRRVKQGNEFERKRAILAASELKDREALPLLVDLLGTRPKDISEEANRSLVNITKQDFGNSGRRWRAWIEDHKKLQRLEWLIMGLTHKNEAIRASAQSELNYLTGLYFGYRYDAPRAERDQNVQRWRAWWAEEADQSQFT